MSKIRLGVLLAALTPFLFLSVASAADIVSPAAMDKLEQQKKAGAKKKAPAKPAAKAPAKVAPAKAPESGKPQSAVEKVESLTIKQNQAPAAVEPKKVEPKAPPKPTGPEYNYILFESKPANAEVTLDGFYMGQTPIELPVKDGSHDVQLSAPGFAKWNRKIMTFAGFRIYAVLEESKQAEAPKP